MTVTHFESLCIDLIRDGLPKDLQALNLLTVKDFQPFCQPLTSSLTVFPKTFRPWIWWQLHTLSPFANHIDLICGGLSKDIQTMNLMTDTLSAFANHGPHLQRSFQRPSGLEFAYSYLHS